MEQPTTYVGIDVAKDGVDIADRPTGHSWQTPYDEAEVTLLVPFPLEDALYRISVHLLIIPT